MDNAQNTKSEITNEQRARVKDFLFDALGNEDLEIILKYFQLRDTTTARPTDGVRPKIELIYGREG